MTSFPAAARRVRDDALTPRNRLLALRECALNFAPYGFRATWHHLVVNARIPHRLEDDLDSLHRAVDELEEARAVWRGRAADFAERRRREKAAGRRVPSRADQWLGNGVHLRCPDFEQHPSDRLIMVVRRVIAAHESGVNPATACLACASALKGANKRCPDCGVLPENAAPRLLARWTAVEAAERWNRTWRRETSR
ncbi:hypothetical protein F4560_003099 [Saccharothrix ecbatanensis]|uniref:Uncharacterized protein n=1 Tax=Saccharothrix ecbatanensis TaxID=1105145 RepID=A0A7W9HJV1_9PSEU|nr:hypothetical protein [Saccharothrix ecbatanensis]MBB5803331.1 hypothetical protein [Saccharothrix ecbatanensis]